MVTYYTALGRLVTKLENGKQIPVVLIEECEYHLSIDELLLWGSLHWSIMDKEALEKEYYRRKADNRIFNDTSFEQTLNRLEVRGLVVSGTDYLAADALYGLIGTLKIRPIRMGFFDKIKSIAYMHFIKRIPFIQCCKLYFGIQITPNEKSVLRMSKHIGITALEIIKCAEDDIKSIKSEDDKMDKLYNEDNATYETIKTYSRFSEIRTDVIKAVANLYLKKKIIFEN